MTEEVKQYLLSVSQEELNKQWMELDHERLLQNMSIGDDETRYRKWTDYLKTMSKGNSDIEQFAGEIETDSLRKYVNEVKRQGLPFNFDKFKEEIKNDFIKYEKKLLKEYGWNKPSEVPWEKYLM